MNLSFDQLPANLKELPLLTAAQRDLQSTPTTNEQVIVFDAANPLARPYRMAMAEFIKFPAGLTVNGSAVTALGIATSTSANALAIGPAGATNPSINVDASTASAATGLNIKSAAAAGGLAVKVLSSGTDESLTIDAKGAGTITLGGTSTGKVSIPKAQITPQVQTIAGDGAITIQSGVVLLTKGSAAAITLAAPSSQDGTIIEVTSTTAFAHVITVTGGMWDGTATTNTTATFPVVQGGAIRLIAFGTAWYVLGLQGVVCAP